MSQLYQLWKTTSAIPFVGQRVFSFAFSRQAPYFGSIHPRVTALRPNHAEVVVPDRRSNHNHIGTVHAIALCNGLEMAMGALAEATIPASKRWIPKGMEVAYTAKATSDITCIEGVGRVRTPRAWRFSARMIRCWRRRRRRPNSIARFII